MIKLPYFGYFMLILSRSVQTNKKTRRQSKKALEHSHHYVIELFCAAMQNFCLFERFVTRLA